MPSETPMATAQNDDVEAVFPEGSKVEVSTDQEGFEGAWYVATVVSPAVRKAKSKMASYLVEYETLLAGDEFDPDKPLRESVGASFIRPVAPTDDDEGGFAVNDVVDAFHRDGWWTGVVIRVGDGDERFVVFFQDPPEEFEFARSELRVHREWVGGNWVRPERKEIINPLSGQECSPPTSTKKKQNRAGPDTNATSIPPLKKWRKRYAEEARLSITPCKNSRPTIRNLGEKALSDSASPTKGGKGIDCLKQSVVGNQTFSETKSSGEKKHEIINQLSNQELSVPTSAKKKQNRAPDTHATRTPPLKKLRKLYAEEAALSITPRKTVRPLNRKLGEEAHPDFTTPAKGGEGIDCSKQSVVGNRGFLKTKSSREKKYQGIRKPNEGVSSRKKGSGKPPKLPTEEEGESSRTRKRGRPLKLSIKEPKEGEKCNGVGGVTCESFLKDGATNEADNVLAIRGADFSAKKGSFRLSKECQKLIADKNPFLYGSRRDNDILSNTTKLHPQKKDSELNETIGKLTGKRSKKRTARKRIDRSITKKRRSAIQDSEKTPNVSENNYSTKDIEVVSDELPGNVFDGQPLLTCLEGQNAPTTMDNPRASPEKTADQIHSPAIAACIDISVDYGQSLTLPKCSPIWESIASMEVFKRMPQKPHFRPLQSCNEDLREGLAIAKMVTFANMVERTSALQPSDPKIIIERSLETLLELKDHGFDIDLLEDRLNQWQKLKEKEEQLADESKEVEREIAKQELENSKIEEENREIAKMIKELQDKLDLAASKKEAEDAKLATLASRLVTSCEALKNVNSDLVKLAASPL